MQKNVDYRKKNWESEIKRKNEKYANKRVKKRMKSYEWEKDRKFRRFYWNERKKKKNEKKERE